MPVAMPIPTAGGESSRGSRPEPNLAGYMETCS
jgi:hypothetical protein